MDNDPTAILNFPNGERHEFDRNHMALHMHFGKLAVYDHIRLAKEEGEIMLVFEPRNLYKTLMQFIVENNFPMYMNKPAVEDLVVEKYIESETNNIDSIPDDWLNDEK